MSKKPADQKSPNGASGEAVDLEGDLDGTDGGNGDLDDEDDDDDEDQSGAGAGGSGEQKSVSELVAEGIAAALPQIQASFQSEMDRRINGALKKKAPAADADKGGDNEDKTPAAPADVRGARIAFREYLPDEIKFFSSEERELGMAYGQTLIRAAAHAGFEDEDEVGRNTAVEVSKFLKTARDLYSARTRRVLKSQGALIDQPAGQTGSGKDAPDSIAALRAAAEKKDRELYPERYVGK